MNDCTFIGRLTADPELFHTQSGKARVRFTLACEDGVYTNDDGEKVRMVEFLDFTAWEGTAEFIAKYFTKGKPMSVKASAKVERWEDKTSGDKRSKVVFRVNKANFLPTTSGHANSVNEDDEQEDEAPPKKTPAKKGSFNPKPSGKGKTRKVEDDDEIESEVLG